jgi:hypothetical protein
MKPAKKFFDTDKTKFMALPARSQQFFENKTVHMQSTSTVAPKQQVAPCLPRSTQVSLLRIMAIRQTTLLAPRMLSISCGSGIRIYRPK